MHLRWTPDKGNQRALRVTWLDGNVQCCGVPVSDASTIDGASGSPRVDKVGVHTTLPHAVPAATKQHISNRSATFGYGSQELTKVPACPRLQQHHSLRALALSESPRHTNNAYSNTYWDPTSAPSPLLIPPSGRLENCEPNTPNCTLATEPGRSQSGRVTDCTTRNTPQRMHTHTRYTYSARTHHDARTHISTKRLVVREGCMGVSQGEVHKHGLEVGGGGGERGQ